MKLEIKHLAAYLPYGLKIRVFREDQIIFIEDLDINGEVIDYIFERNEFSKNIYKPILRPLSDLTKEIEVNGERFVPIKELFQMAYFSIYGEYYINPNYTMINEEYYALKAEERVSKIIYNYGFTIELPNQFLMSCNGDYLTIPNFTMYEKLFEWHFDIFNLIQNNLAIDINTLK